MNGQNQIGKRQSKFSWIKYVRYSRVKRGRMPKRGCNATRAGVPPSILRLCKLMTELVGSDILTDSPGWGIRIRQTL